MSEMELRFRQVHLDFHTSEAIEGIAADFDPDEFADTLAEAHVNSITCFARGHHGWIYYDSKRNPERVHPHLARRNLLAEQIEACHARDIRVPVYITVQWDHYTAGEHPEWVCLGADGRLNGTPPFEAGFYRRLCLNSPYVEFLKGHTQEVLETLAADGIFFDIVAATECCCPRCVEGMKADGLEPSDPAARMQYAVRVVNDFQHEMTRFVRRLNKDCSIFYNAGHVGPQNRQVADAFTHWELESLPSGGWGYLHFPLTMRYARTLGKPCLGMTGKFHTTWGDFGSFKNPAALQFECFQMLALNGRCSVGDQLHPSGKICQATYDLIGSVYAEVEKAEPWCRGAAPVADVAVLTPEESAGAVGHTGIPEAAMGAVRMLQEGAHQFDVIDSAADFGKYRLLILPDEIAVSPELARKIDAFLGGGGALIASHKSGLDAGGADFALAPLGLTLMGEAPYSPDFIVPAGAIGKGLPETGHVMYLRGMEVVPDDAAEVLAQVEVPYFNRTYRHFCSHRHTPTSRKVGYPGVVRNGSAIYFAHPIFTQYQQNAPRWCKRLLLNAIDVLLPDPLVRIEAPTTTVVTLNAQPGENRQVLHLLHYVPERRGAAFDVIEDVIPIRDVKVSVRIDPKVESVARVPQDETLEFTQAHGRVAFTLGELHGHQMVALNFA